MAYALKILESTAQLRAAAARWDDLWHRSHVALPTVRADIIALWAERFSPGGQFQALIAAEGERFLAALPLTPFRLRRFLRVATLPGEDWYPGSELLLDPRCDVDQAMDVLVRGLRRVKLPLLWLQGIERDAAYWQAWVAAVNRAGLPCDVAPHWDVGRIRIQGDWDAYYGGRPGDFRRELRRRTRKLEAQGTLSYRTFDGASASKETLREHLERAFDVELRSWKSAQGTAVLQNPKEFEFFVDQSRRIAAWGQLLVCTLELNGRPIAFEYGYLSKGVFFPHKISYDEAYARYSAAQVLRVRQLEDFWRRGNVHCVDYIGPISEAILPWTREAYTTGRVMAAPPTFSGRAVFWLCRQVLKRRARKAANAQSAPAPPAAPGTAPHAHVPGDAPSSGAAAAPVVLVTETVGEPVSSSGQEAPAGL